MRIAAYPVNRGLARATLTTAFAVAIGRGVLPAPLAGTGDDAEAEATSALAPFVTVAALTLARSLKVATNVLR